MTELAHAISVALLHFVWQGLLVAFVLWVALAMLGHRPVRLRYALSCAALLLMIAAPVVTVCLVYRAAGPATVYSGPFVRTEGAIDPVALAMTELLPRWIAVAEVWTLPLWSAGVVILALRLVWSSRHVSRLRRDGEPAPSAVVEVVSRLAQRVGVARPVQVLVSQLAESPSVVGWLRPVILVPTASLLNLNAGQLEAVLVHELAHIRRHDYLANLLQAVAETVLFYQPAVWWVSARIRAERELCCDDVAVEVCGDSVEYARALTLLERARLAPPELAMSSAAGPVFRRVLRLTGSEQRTPRVPALVAVSLAALCLLPTVRWAQAQPPMAGEARVSKDAIWVDTVKFGELPVLVRALGTLSGRDTVELQVPVAVAGDVRLGQSASVEVTRRTIVAGTVTRIDAPPPSGTVRVVVQLKDPQGQAAGQPVDGVIRVRVLQDVVYVGRPAGQSGGAEVWLFRLDADQKSASRVKVRLGAASVNAVQVMEGLAPGERIIVSDMGKFDGYARVRVE